MEKIKELTVLRFFAAIIVVTYHYGLDSLKLSSALVSGPAIVTFFFVLSGFVMYLSHKNRNEKYLSFYISRLIRIYPIYILALIVFMSFCYINDINQSKSAIAYNLMLIQSAIPPFPLSLNSPGWAASVEIAFYILFPATLLMLNNKNTKPRSMVLYSLMLWATTQLFLIFILNNGYYDGFPSTSHDFIYYFPISHLCSFFLGIGGAMLFNDLKNTINTNEQNKNITLILSITLPFFIQYITIKNNTHATLQIPWGSSLFAPLFLTMILLVSLFRSKTSKEGANKSGIWPLLIPHHSI